MGPTQLNIPRDYFYGEITCEIPKPMRVERGAGGENSLNAAAELLASAKFPVHHRPAAAWSWAMRSRNARRWPSGSARRWSTATCATTRFPASHPLWCGPLGYQGSQGGDEADRAGRRGDRARLAAWARSARCRSTAWTTGRRTPRSSRSKPTTPMLGLVKKITVGICGDAKAAAAALLARLAGQHAGLRRHQGRSAPRRSRPRKAAWEKELGRLDARARRRTAWT